MIAKSSLTSYAFLCFHWCLLYSLGTLHWRHTPVWGRINTVHLSTCSISIQTQPSSTRSSHPPTVMTQCYLTSLFKRELVFPTWLNLWHRYPKTWNNLRFWVILYRHPTLEYFDEFYVCWSHKPLSFQLRATLKVWIHFSEARKAFFRKSIEKVDVFRRHNFRKLLSVRCELLAQEEKWGTLRNWKKEEASISAISLARPLKQKLIEFRAKLKLVGLVEIIGMKYTWLNIWPTDT